MRKPTILTDDQMYDIYSMYIEDGTSKTALASQYGVSVRTIGRALDWVDNDMNDRYIECEQRTGYDLNDTLKNESVDDFQYFVVANRALINVTRVDPTGEVDPESQIVYSSDKRFNDLLSMIQDDNAEGVFNILSSKIVMEKLTEGRVTFDPTVPAMIVNYGGQEYQFGHESMINRLVDRIRNGEDVTGLMRFADRLANNPHKEVINELYQFLTASDIIINDDGMVECYKRVRDNFTDCHTGKFDNSVGKTVEMPRAMVDNNSRNLCSAGLHVCSKAYLPSFGGARVIKVMVDPADFVSIPEDYYSIDGQGSVKAKARVCKYVVIREEKL